MDIFGNSRLLIVVFIATYLPSTNFHFNKNRYRDGVQLNGNIQLFPVIGILAQEFYEDSNYSYIAASYVKFIESAGAVVIPIRINQSNEYYRTVLQNINGLLLPGGEANITNSHYYHVSRMFFKWAMELNDIGTFFPIFGICLGFEELLYLVTGVNYLTECRGRDQACSIKLTKDSNSSTIIKQMPKHVLEDITTKNITYNSHGYCLSAENINEDLRKFFYMPATSKDHDGFEHVAMIEAKRYPFFGTQWHPEKPQFEWKSPAIPHNTDSIQCGMYFSKVFIEMAKKNTNRFDIKHLDLLSYNYQPEYSANYSPFMQIYKFDDL